ncbi:MAG: SH3 domain-containing protein [Clostridia bacterium]|nr:SH3 domain-containing protein [Clostridia bacterium]
MATTVQKYLAKCQEIVDAQPVYKLGASDLKECDCIGMDKYSFRENGVSFSTTGTNYSARYQVDNFRSINNNLDLNVGDVVFKAYEPGESGWALPEKYQEGGSQYNGDLRDYCHIGTVKSVEPLQIIHMTSPSAKTDTKIGKWRFAGNWKKEYISDTPGPEPEPPTPTPKTATVVSDNGKPVKMRAKPSTSCNLYWEIPVGTVVDVVEMTGGSWTKIRWQGITGYMMTKFLCFAEDPSTKLYTVVIPFLTEDQADALIAQYPGAWKEKE